MRQSPSALQKYMTNTVEYPHTDINTKMQNEWARFVSFEKFPRSEGVSGLRLAQNGFYANGQEPFAICFSCGMVNRNWPEGESIAQTHRRISPTCKLVRGVEETNISINDCSTDSETGAKANEPAIAESQIQQNTNTRGNDADEATRLSAPDDEAEQGTVVCVLPSPKYMMYNSKTERLNSFTAWIHGDRVTPEMLAEAGLFYTGMGDCVRCFYCGGGLRSWEEGDAPWVEHARWFPSCQYVLHQKGQDFVNMCATSNIEEYLHEHLILSNSQNVSSEEELIIEENFNQSYESSESENDDNHLISSADNASEIKDMGYTAQQINAAIQELSDARRTVAFTKETIVETLLQQNNEIGYEREPENPIEPYYVGENSQDKRYEFIDTQEKNKSKDQSSKENKGTDKGQDCSISTENRTALLEENTRLKQSMQCKICMDSDCNVVFVPCGHMVACLKCARNIRGNKCPICRKRIQATIRAFPV